VTKLLQKYGRSGFSGLLKRVWSTCCKTEP